MSPDHTVQNAASDAASDVVRAVMKAASGRDVAQVAFDIVNAAALVAAGDDAAVKSAVALYMLRMARRLDDDVTETTTLQ
jgi:hypothetical protein